MVMCWLIKGKVELIEIGNVFFPSIISSTSSVVIIIILASIKHTSFLDEFIIPPPALSPISHNLQLPQLI